MRWTRASAGLSVWAMVLAGFSTAMATTPLDDYVNAPDATYSWSISTTNVGTNSTDYILTMDSQTWQPPETVSQPVWSHIVRVTIPNTVSSNIGLVRIGSGSNPNTPPTNNRAELRAIAEATGTVTAEIMYIPNQPLAFQDGINRWEDDQIAYCWARFLESEDPIWLSRLPMTKAVVRAMDTLTALADQEASETVDEFVVFGASKRGWTTWTTAAVDGRVIAFAPQVIDLLNLLPSFEHHFMALGFWATAINDYLVHGIDAWMGTPEYQLLLDYVDPYSYLHRFGTERIFIMNSAGDEFFLPDSSQFYWDDVPGPKHLRYFPNTGHGLDSSAWDSLALWYEAVINDDPLPSFTWSMEPDGSIVVDTSGTSPSEVILWQATNPNARDFNHSLYGNLYTSSTLSPSGPDTYTAQVAEPPDGWTAFFVEVRYPSGGATPHRFTTEVSVVPDTYVAPSPINNPLNCPPGREPDSEGETCIDCQPGSFSDDGTECIECPAGTFAASAGAESCNACPAGRESSPDRTECLECDPGTFSADGMECVACPAGTVSPSAGAASCFPCAAGQEPNIDATGCDFCPPGTFSADGLECLDCPSGTFSSSAGSPSCNACPPGSEANASGTACDLCPPGTFSADGFACVGCPAGTVSQSSGADECTGCPAGTEPNIDGTSCDLCPPGTFSDDGAACLDCPSGTVSSTAGSASCNACPPGSEANASGTGCDLCPPGTFSADGFACVGCPAGTVSQTSGADECIGCPAGAEPNIDGTSCDLCPPGTFSDDGAACATCPAGTFSNTSGAAQCSACPPGFVSTQDRTGCVEDTGGNGDGGFPPVPSGVPLSPLVPATLAAVASAVAIQRLRRARKFD